jgi:signal transduction histidine kinase
VQETLQLSEPLSATRSYGLAVFSVSVALGGGLLLARYGFTGVADPLFLSAIAITVWYAGTGPAILAVVLSSVADTYFFIPPIYSFYITPEEIPHFVIFLLFASLLTWFSAVRRRTERALLKSRDELRKLNEELGKRSTELEASNKELEAFAYSISHDLRAPLRHIAGFTELLKKNAASQLNDKSQRYVTMILESAKRMGDLIDDLLAFSRMSRTEANKTTVNLGQLVQEALGEVGRETGGRNIVWRVGALPDLCGDRSMLRVALINLISNAVKFTRSRPQAEIEIACMDQEQDQAVLFIRDNGVGFDMKYVDKLFGVFQRLHAPEAFEGTGIGLATVQRIVHRHGGRIWAEALVDKGATFYFSLPKSRESNI